MLRRREYQRRWRENNRKKVREYQRQWTKNNQGKLRDQLRQWHETQRQFRECNREKIYFRQRDWVRQNRQRVRKHWRQWHINRQQENPQYLLTVALRRRLNGFVRRGRAKKIGRTSSLIGCHIEELKIHIEKQFKKEMTWKNHGTVWHVDHIIPCCKFDLTDPIQQARCFNYLNLQPLCARENIRKGGRIEGPAQMALGL